MQTPAIVPEPDPLWLYAPIMTVVLFVGAAAEDMRGCFTLVRSQPIVWSIPA